MFIDQSEFVTDKDILTMIFTFSTSIFVAVLTAFVTAKFAEEHDRKANAVIVDALQEYLAKPA